MVIGNSIPDKTGWELTNFGIESRAITVEQMSAALQKCDVCDAVVKGLRLIPDDPSKVRYLLSDHDAVAVPEGLKFEAPWSHEKVFLALARREKHKDLWKKNIYVQLYRQRPNCAVLYGPKVESAKRAPLHLNRRAASWNSTVFDRILPAIEYVQSDNKGPGRERTNFDHYRIKDWGVFAEAIKVHASADLADAPT